MEMVREASSKKRSKTLGTLIAAMLALGAVVGHAQAPAPAAAPSSAKDDAAKAEEVDAAQTELIARALSPDPSGLTAEEVVNKALKHSPMLVKSNKQASKAEANAARAKLAFLPRLDVSGRYTHLNEVTLPPLDFNGTKTPNPFPQILNQWAGTASVRVPITDLFLTILPTYKSAKLASGVARAEEDARKLSAAYEARMAFYTYLRARGATVVREDSVRVLEAHVADLAALAGAGAATETDRVRAEARLAQAKFALAQTLGAVEVSLVRLSRIAGENLDSSRAIGEQLIDPAPERIPEAGDALSEAFELRPELRALRKLINVREEQESARWGGQLPVLSATGNLYSSRPNPRVFPAKDEFRESWDVGLALSWSPNDYLQARSQTQDAEIDTDMVHDDMHLLEDNIAVEVASAVVDSRLALERIRTTEQNAKAAARHYSDQRALMMAGAVTPSDVLEAEQEMRQAQLEWVDAYIQAKMARATLLKARGYVTTNEAPIAQGTAP